MNSDKHEFLNKKLGEDILDIVMDKEAGRKSVSETMDRILHRVEASYDLGVSDNSALTAARQLAEAVDEIARTKPELSSCACNQCDAIRKAVKLVTGFRAADTGASS